MDIIFEWHGYDTVILVKELMSTASTRRQRLHRDYCGLPDEEDDKRKRKHFRNDILFSAILSLEKNDNSSRIIKSNDKEVVIPQGCVLLWRGDYAHAGAAYTQVNRRLFFHILGPNVDISIVEDVEFA